ncbi:MAG: rocF [Bacteroidota bacterium]|nr:rocF [Bacteroidota bacterium]
MAVKQSGVKKGRQIRLIEVKSEVGAGTRGASLGIDAIKIAALDFRSNFFKTHRSINIPDDNAALFGMIESRYAKRIRSVLKMYERVGAAVRDSLKDGKFPIMLSGDHSTAGGTMAGIRMAYPDSRLGVIWIDAHADLHSPYTTPSGNMHGMALATAVAEDNIENKVNDLDYETIELWERLKNVGDIAPKLEYRDLLFMTLRDFEEQEGYLIKQHKIKNISTSEIKKTGVTKICREAMKYLSHCDKVYITFDVDALDPSISRGTGTPVKGGLNEREAADIILELVQNERVCCLEFTEINPTLDSENVMAETVFEILQKVARQVEII